MKESLRCIHIFSVYGNRKRGLIFLAIPLALAGITHLWNPIGFLAPEHDEAIYMRRTMNVLAGFGPQEAGKVYDHPYFGQLFVAGILALIGYPNSLHPAIGNLQSIEMLYVVPRLLMGLLAVVDRC